MSDTSNNQIIDVSSNEVALLEQQERRKKIIEVKREQYRITLRDLVMRQTDYDAETAMQKLKKYDGNVMMIIREYMGPSKKIESNNPTSTNQVIMKEIRTMMDTASANYRIKKDLEERKNMFIEKMQNTQKEAAKKLQDSVNE